jgi:hypothetical protein
VLIEVPRQLAEVVISWIDYALKCGSELKHRNWKETPEFAIIPPQSFGTFGTFG